MFVSPSSVALLLLLVATCSSGRLPKTSPLMEMSTKKTENTANSCAFPELAGSSIMFQIVRRISPNFNVLNMFGLSCSSSSSSSSSCKKKSVRCSRIPSAYQLPSTTTRSQVLVGNYPPVLQFFYDIHRTQISRLMDHTWRFLLAYHIISYQYRWDRTDKRYETVMEVFQSRTRTSDWSRHQHSSRSLICW